MSDAPHAIVEKLIEKLDRFKRGSWLAEDGHPLDWLDQVRDVLLTAARPEKALQHELNAWRELGEEMGRIVSMMTPDDATDYLPDWFGPRLFDLQVKRQAAVSHADLHAGGDHDERPNGGDLAPGRAGAVKAVLLADGRGGNLPIPATLHHRANSAVPRDGGTDAVAAQKVCGAPTPDRTGRTCDKPAGHGGDHWTYGGNEKTWPADRLPSVGQQVGVFSECEQFTSGGLGNVAPAGERPQLLAERTDSGALIPQRPQQATGDLGDVVVGHAHGADSTAAAPIPSAQHGPFCSTDCACGLGNGPRLSAKCDGDHGIPRCADQECWQGAPLPSAPEKAPIELLRELEQWFGDRVANGNVGPRTAREMEDWQSRLAGYLFDSPLQPPQARSSSSKTKKNEEGIRDGAA